MICKHLPPLMRLMGLWAMCMLASPCWGQTQADDSSVDPRLESVPLKIEAMGLLLHPPAGANIAAQRAEGKLSIGINDPIVNPRWSVTFQLIDSSLEIPTAEAQIDDHLQALATRGTQFKVISNGRVLIDNLPSQLCYIEQSTASGQSYISGWLIVPAGARTFLVGAVLAMPDSFAEFRPILEASFSTIKLTSQEEISLRLRSEIEAGKRFLESVTPEQLQATAAKAQPQWRRVYIPSTGAGGAEQEVGYMHVDTFAGKRGLVNPSRREIRYDDAEHEEGLVVQIYVRVLEGKDIRDVEMVYWMAWDQQQESFSVRGTRRQGEASLSESITGVRADQQVPSQSKEQSLRFEPMLTVVTASGDSRVRDPASWVVPESYLSQALNWTLADLMPRDGQRHVYGYYFFDMAMAQPSLQRRVDTWEPLSPDDPSGRWRLSSRMGDSEQSLVTIYGSDGQFIKRMHPDGAVTEAISLDALTRLWKSKNLPLSADDLKPRRRGS